MYAGILLSSKSGRIVGVHQKIDRVALRHIRKYIPRRSTFPTIKEILHFEGLRGPDGMKRKSPGDEVIWHFVDPSDPTDTQIFTYIHDHMHNLSQALADNNRERASFEAAWLSHTIVDGLTPAHHYPLDKKIEELWGKPHHERESIMEQMTIKGKSPSDTLSKNWQYWGTKGVFTAHIAFELGVASVISGKKFESALPTRDELKRIEEIGFDAYFRGSLATIYSMNLYERFAEGGWTRDLADETCNTMMPIIIRTVSLAWYSAYRTSLEMKS